MKQELYICYCGLTFSLICTLIVECRQMCWTCQYLKPGQGIECTTSPANWTGGESRVKCPTKCIITADYETGSGEVKFFYRGCGESSRNGCSEFGATYSCFFACDGSDYCNGQSLLKSPLLDKKSPMQSAKVNLPMNKMTLVSLMLCICIYLY